MAEFPIPLNSINPALVRLGAPDLKTWDFDRDGQSFKGSQKFAKVFYGEGKRFLVELHNLKTRGIMCGTSYNKGFMNINPPDDQQTMIRAKIDMPISQLVFDHKEKFFEDADELEDVRELRKHNFVGLLRKGKKKKDKPGERWPDSITADVRMKKQTPIEHEISIEDEEGNAYNWQALADKVCTEIGLEIDRIALGPDGRIRVKSIVRVIVVKDLAKAKIISNHRRKLQQAAAAAAPSSAVAATPAPAPAPAAKDPGAAAHAGARGPPNPVKRRRVEKPKGKGKA